MISPLLMVSKQLFEFENGQIVAYNDCGLLLYDIAKKLNWYHSSIDVFLKNCNKTRNYHQKEDHSHKRKNTALEDTKIIWLIKQQHIVTPQQLKIFYVSFLFCLIL